MHGADPVERGNLFDQRVLLGLAEVGGDPGVEDDEWAPCPRWWRATSGQVRQHVAAFESRRVRRCPHVGQGGAEASEPHGVVGPLARLEPARLVVGEWVDRREVEPDPLGHAREAELGEGREVVARRRTSSWTAERSVPAVTAALPADGSVGVGVVVEEQVEAGRCPEVEQRQGLGPVVLRGDVAEAGQQPGAASDLVRLRRAGGDELLDRGSVEAAEVGERRRDVTSGRRSEGDTAHEGHGVVVGGERVLGAGEKERMHGGQQQERAPLGERRAVEQGQDFCVVGDAAADGGVGAAAVALDRGRERQEVTGERLVDEHVLPRSWRGAAG